MIATAAKGQTMDKDRSAEFNKLPRAIVKARISSELLLAALNRAKSALDDFKVYTEGYRAGYADGLNQRPNKSLH
jgi:hypothetical protein